MHRVSKPRFDRISSVTRLMTIVYVLLCGFLVSGLHGPNGLGLALAEDKVTQDESKIESYQPTNTQLKNEPRGPVLIYEVDPNSALGGGTASEMERLPNGVERG